VLVLNVNVSKINKYNVGGKKNRIYTKFKQKTELTTTTKIIGPY